LEIMTKLSNQTALLLCMENDIYIYIYYNIDLEITRYGDQVTKEEKHFYRQ